MLKNALILGASSGIGREMALRLAADGWRVTAAARRLPLLEELARRHPDRIFPDEIDVTDTAALPRRLDAAAEQLGGAGLVVISAGAGFLNPGLETGPEIDTLAVNTAAFTAAACWAYRYFRTAGAGHLAVITSVGGLVGEGLAPAYCASKAYQIMYLEALRKRARKECPGLVITELRPGSVDTAMMKGEGHFWVSSPESAAAAACRAVFRKKRLQYISPRWSLIGTLLRLRHVFS